MPRNRALKAVRRNRSFEREQYDSGATAKAFRALQKLAQDENPVRANATELVAKCAGFSDCDERAFSEALIKHGKAPVSARINGGIPLKRYVISKQEIDEICATYYTAEPRCGFVVVACGC